MWDNPVEYELVRERFPLPVAERSIYKTSLLLPGPDPRTLYHFKYPLKQKAGICNPEWSNPMVAAKNPGSRLRVS